MSRSILIALLHIAAASVLSARSIYDTSTARTLIERNCALGRLSGSVLIAHGDRAILEMSCGDAVKEHHVPNASDTRFFIGSLSKPFTAAAVLRLVDQGRIDLHAPIGRYLPDIPAAIGGQVTAHHLLSHSSGIPSLGRRGDGLDEVKTTIDPISLEDLVALSSSKELLFKPGTKYRYSNTGYAVLALLVERISGMKYAEFLRREIFDPAAMRGSGEGDGESIIDRVAEPYSGYEPDVRKPRAEHPSWHRGGGSLYSTTRDLFAWSRALTSGRLLSPPLVAESIRAQAPLPGDARYQYGYGWFVYSQGGQRVVNHGGTLEGWISALFLLPERDLTVVILTNYMPRLGVDVPDALGTAVIDSLLGRPVDLPPSRGRSSPQLRKALDGVTGTCAPGMTFAIRGEDGALQLEATGSAPWSPFTLARAAGVDAGDPFVTRSAAILDQLLHDQIPAVIERMTPEWRGRTNSAELVAAVKRLTDAHGRAVRHAAFEVSNGKFVSVTFRVRFERADLNIEIIQDHDGRFAGWWNGTARQPAQVLLEPSSDGGFFANGFAFREKDIRIDAGDRRLVIDGVTCTIDRGGAPR